MTDNQTQSAPETPETEEEQKGRWNAQSITLLVGGVLGGIVLVIFVIGLLLALFSDVDATAARVQIIRDIFLIILSLQSIVIVVALIVLIFQISKLINMLRNEVMPILNNTQDTLQSAKGTVEFVGKNVSEPIVRVSGFFAGLRVLFREVFGIRRAVRSQPDKREQVMEKGADQHGG